MQTNVNNLLTHRVTGRVYRVVSQIQVEAGSKGRVSNGLRLRYFNPRPTAPVGIVDRAVPMQVVYAMYRQYGGELNNPAPDPGES